MNNPKIKHSATDCNVFFEQVFFASMTKREKRKVTCILNREMLDQGYSTADCCNLTQFDHKQFFHILGGHKQNIEICKQLAQILLSKHPAYCLKILSLFPSKNVRFLIEKENKSILGVEKSLAQYEDFLLKQKKEWAGILFDKLYNLEKAITCYSHFADMRQSERKKCFFVVMEYMGSKYGLKDRSYNDYFNEFQNDSTNMNNAYLEEDTVKIGPADYLPIKSEDGKTTESQPNPYTYKYIDKYFETRDNGWQEGEDKLRNYYKEKPASRKGNKVFGVIKIEDNGEEKAHAVVITGVQGNYVDYNDPARGESNQSIGFDKFEYFSVIKGLKKDENE